jgi:hypothetical protein
MPLAGFEPATPATKRLQTYALDSAAAGIGPISLRNPEKHYISVLHNPPYCAKEKSVILRTH